MYTIAQSLGTLSIETLGLRMQFMRRHIRDLPFYLCFHQLVIHNQRCHPSHARQTPEIYFVKLLGRAKLIWLHLPHSASSIFETSCHISRPSSAYIVFIHPPNLINHAAKNASIPQNTIPSPITSHYPSPRRSTEEEEKHDNLPFFSQRAIRSAMHRTPGVNPNGTASAPQTQISF